MKYRAQKVVCINYIMLIGKCKNILVWHKNCILFLQGKFLLEQYCLWWTYVVEYSKILSFKKITNLL